MKIESLLLQVLDLEPLENERELFFFESKARGNDYEVTLADTNPHVIVQSVHVRRIFNRMQRNSTVNLFFLQVSGERLRPGTVVIQDRLHLQKRKLIQ